LNFFVDLAAFKTLQAKATNAVELKYRKPRKIGVESKYAPV